MFIKFKKILRKFRFWRIFLYKFKDEYSLFKQFNFLNKNSIFIDIGANIGSVSEVINDLYSCKIICYEPHPGAYKILSKKFENSQNITLYNFAVSNERASKNLFLHKNTNINDISDLNLSEASSLDEKKTNIDLNKKIRIQTIDIEDIISKFRFIDCIKIDIEGYEYKILPIIFKNKKKIGRVFCEFHGNKLKKKSNSHLNSEYLSAINFIKKNNLQNWITEWI